MADSKLISVVEVAEGAYGRGYKRGFSDGREASGPMGLPAADSISGEGPPGEGSGKGSDSWTLVSQREEWKEEEEKTQGEGYGNWRAEGSSAGKKKVFKRWSEWQAQADLTPTDEAYPNFEYKDDDDSWKAFRLKWQTVLRAGWDMAGPNATPNFQHVFPDDGWTYAIHIVGHTPSELPESFREIPHCVGYQVNQTMSPEKQRPIRVIPSYASAS